MMDEPKVEIQGLEVLSGELKLSGAKNAALPMIAAACMGDEPTILDNVPTGLNDIILMIDLMRAMGAEIEINGTTLICARGSIRGGRAPEGLASKVRTSLLLLGVFAGLKSEVYLPQPGGCDLGSRKYDLHLMGLGALGAQIVEDDGGVQLRSNGLSGARIDFYLPSTTGTENVMIAAVLAAGSTRLRNANTRPEVQQLGYLLAAMGGRVHVQNRIVEIEGVERLKGGARVSVMPGWDEAVTYIVAAGMTSGEIVIPDFSLAHIREDARYLREAGINLFEWHGNIYISARPERKTFDLFTAPYPGVNSDMQPIFAALALVTPGTSTITDLRFTERFRYVEELQRFGGEIQSFGNTAIIQGGKPLTGARVSATDLRGGMACVLAGLAARGTTTIENIYQIERGYDRFAEKLAMLGASIKRIP